MYARDPNRLHLLLETRRIEYNNLPFRSGEYDDLMIINDLVVKEKFQVTINAKTVNHSIIELYSPAKKEVVHLLRQTQASGLSYFTIVADFWTSKVQAAKYIGVRVYWVDQRWNLRSVLLGVRRFNP